MAFDWRQSVQLSPDFTPAERAQVEQSLDFIASGRDNEGMVLLEAAARNSGLPTRGGRILIAPAINGSGTREQDGIIRIDFSEAQEVVFTDEVTGESRQGTLDGLAVHEIFHSSQPRRTDALIQMIDNDPSLSPEDRTLLEGQAMRLGRYQSNRAMIETLRPGATRDELMAEQRELIFNPDPRLPAYVAALPPRRLDAEGIPEREQEATRFAAAFLEKNAGDREPVRREYQNAGRSGANSGVISFGPTGELHPTMGDQQTRSADAISTSPALPTVAPVPETSRPSQAAPQTPSPALLSVLPTGFDLSGLAGVSHDASVVVSRADTGRLSSQASPAQPIERGGTAVAV